MSTQEISDFEKWCYTAQDPRTGLPFLTTLLYRICDNDEAKFDEGCRLLQEAFEAGQRKGLKANG
jgi:hypothetical protein